MVTIRCLISIVVVNKWPLYQLDVNNAFLYGDHVEDVYMTLLDGYNNVDKSKVCKLNKSLYGFKQPPRQWNAKLTTALVEHGFEQSKFDYSLYTKHRSGMFIALWSLKYFLGIEVVDNDLGLYMTQRKYCMELLHEYGLLAARPVDIPLPENTILSCDETENDKYLSDFTTYQIFVGNLIYLTNTRPNISYDVHCLSQHMHSPLQYHFKAALRVLRTKHFELDVHFVREKVLAGVIKTTKVSSNLQIVDVFTKCLGVIHHKLCCKNLGLLDIFAGEFVGKVSGRKAQAPKKKVRKDSCSSN
ncbi:ribonuclease H-like domain-containing protein [Tanacetum coccineum]|uniref:Ribonuclease H-like domain-containing protein n=1 Tax=Tanacetum coccineum TaxID=301880 RepID=A0ABQ4X8F3_9ASTR